jgi:hypothetical protein
MPKKITMPDGRTGVVEYPPANPLRYRVRWKDGTEGTITPAQFDSADKAPLDDEPN